MSPVLVTGAGGFVGSHVCEALQGRGDAVVALLGPEDTHVPEASRVLRGSILDAPLLNDALHGVARVVHAAGPPSVADSFADPARYAQAHVAGTAALMKAACERGVEAIVHVSSAEVYGRPRAEPVAEEHPCCPISPYGAAKLGGEWMARTICGSAPVALTVLRPFSLYGARMRRSSVLGSILDQLRVGSTVALFDFRPVRDYLHIDDFCALAMAALDAGADATLNACSGEGVSIADLAAAAGGATLVERGGSERPTDILSLIGSHAAASALLGWRPRIGLAAGIAAMRA